MRSLCASLMLLLAGCSSFQPAAEHIRPVPAERLLAHQQPLQDAAEVWVQRDLGWLGGGCYVAVLINHQVAARIGVGERARFQLPPGRHRVGIGVDRQDDTLCGKGRLQREQQVQLSAGQRQDFRIVSEASSGFDIRPLQP